MSEDLIAAIVFAIPPTVAALASFRKIRNVHDDVNEKLEVLFKEINLALAEIRRLTIKERFLEESGAKS